VSLSWPRRLEVALSPEGAAWTARAAQGRCAGAPAAAFAAALAAAPAEARRVHVTLCGSLVHYLAVPWPAAMAGAGAAEGAALAAHHFQRVFGEAAAGWAVRFDHEEGGLVRLACATEQSLLDALHAAAREAGRRVTSVQPFLAAAFNGWRREFGKGNALFVTLEPGRWCAALLGGNAWRAVRSGRLEGEAAATLLGVVARETAQAGDAELPVRVYAPAYPRLGEQLEGLGGRVTLLQRQEEPLHAPAAN
jgi:hypothetical protein